MILRSITEHVKAQNWFAVGLDFLIVVLGVFVGLQVQQWAGDRDQRQSEAIYLERLHGEVLQSLNLRAENVAHRYRVIEGLNSAYQKLFDPNPAMDLSPSECGSIAYAHIMSQLTPNLPTLTELLSAGRLDTLSSAETRTTLIGFVQQQNREADALTAINNTVSPLYRRYPELIELRGVEDMMNAPGPFTAQCDTAKMRESRPFLNDFIDIRARYTGYIQTIETASDGLARLDGAFDAELGLDHGEALAP